MNLDLFTSFYKHFEEKDENKSQPQAGGCIVATNLFSTVLV